MRLQIRVALLCICFAANAQATQVPFGSQQVISTAADYARSIYAPDLEGNGDMDVLSASQNDDKIAWYDALDLIERFISPGKEW